MFCCLKICFFLSLLHSLISSLLILNVAILYSFKYAKLLKKSLFAPNNCFFVVCLCAFEWFFSLSSSHPMILCNSQNKLRIRIYNILTLIIMLYKLYLCLARWHFNKFMQKYWNFLQFVCNISMTINKNLMNLLYF